MNSTKAVAIDMKVDKPLAKKSGIWVFPCLLYWPYNLFYQMLSYTWKVSQHTAWILCLAGQGGLCSVADFLLPWTGKGN